MSPGKLASVLYLATEPWLPQSRDVIGIVVVWKGAYLRLDGLVLQAALVFDDSDRCDKLELMQLGHGINAGKRW